MSDDILRRLGDVEPSTRAVAAEILAHLDAIGLPLPDHPKTDDPVVWGMGSSSEHATGRALDFMMGIHAEVGRAIYEYAWANRDRFGVIHIIYDRRITSTRISPGEVRRMPEYNDVTLNHIDHPHILLDGTAALEAPAASPGAQSIPPKITPPKRESLTVDLVNLRTATAANLVKGAGVKPLQRLLAVAADGQGVAQQAAGVTRDYVFGPDTAEALLAGKGRI